MCRTRAMYFSSDSFALRVTCYTASMELELGAKRRLRRRQLPLLEFVLFIGFAFCLVLGAGALAALWLVRDSPEPVLENSPLSAFVTDKISSPLALMQLTGNSAEGLAFQALNAGELDTAYTTVL